MPVLLHLRCLEREIETPVLVLHLALYNGLHVAVLEIRTNQIHIDIVWNVVTSGVVNGRLGARARPGSIGGQGNV